MGSRILMLFFATTLFTFAEVASFPSDTIVAVPPNVSNQKSNDSPLEHIHVKQETGFDGKVRSIRFSLEPDNEKQSGSHIVHRSRTKSPAIDATTASPTSKTDGNDKSALVKPDESRTRNMRMARTNEMLPIKIHSVRSRRHVEESLTNNVSNELEDLQAEEAKVFRPLFVYRQQVARRLKLNNDRSSVSNRRRTLRRPNNYGYYHPYHYYPPYYYYPYPYFY